MKRTTRVWLGIILAFVVFASTLVVSNLLLTAKGFANFSSAQINEQKEAILRSILPNYTRIIIILLGISAFILSWTLLLQYMVRRRTADLISVNTHLRESQEDLSTTNEELLTTIRQLTATTNKFKKQNELSSMLEQELLKESNLLRHTLMSMGEGVVATNNRSEIIMINQVAELLCGWENHSAIGRFYRDVFPGDNERIVEDVIYTEAIQEIDEQTLEDVHGVSRIVTSTVAPIQDIKGITRGAVVVFRDISEFVRQRDEIKFLSYHDPLTGLLNRRAFNLELQRLDQSAKLPLSVISIDVNGLKLINDAFGHSLGDELLIKVSKILRHGVGDSGIIVRLGGDEFAIILPKTAFSVAEAMVKNIQSLIGQERVNSIQISVAFGVATKDELGYNLQEVFNLAEERMYSDKLFTNVEQDTVDFVLNSLFERSSYEKEHAEGVALLAKTMGQILDLSSRDISELYSTGFFHDIGKIAIEDEVLHKEGPLSFKEWTLMKRHPEFGYRILRGIQDMGEIAHIILAHHEHYDGSGYPKGLRGEEIPFKARIISIVDAFDAMIKNDIYRPVFTVEEAVAELRNHAGTQFDPNLVDIFINDALPLVEKEIINESGKK